MAAVRQIVMSDFAWPSAWAGDIAGAEVVVGDVDDVVAALPTAHAIDLADAGRRKGEQLRLFLKRRGLLRSLVARRLGTAADAVEIGYDVRGTPLLRRPATRLFVSVTARGPVAGFALAETPVGIDLEPVVVGGAIPAMLTKGERRALTSTADEGRLAMTLQLWTAKEAYLKRLGVGLSRDPAEIEIEYLGNRAFSVRDGGSGGLAEPPGQGSWRFLGLHGRQLVVAVYGEQA